MPRSVMTMGVKPEPFPTEEMFSYVPGNCYLAMNSIHSSMIYELQMPAKEESIMISYVLSIHAKT